MLIINRKRTQKIIIAHNIEITILNFGRGIVRFGITAPKDVIIQKRTKKAAAARGSTVQ